MTRVPILTEALLRAWGTDDPRVVPMLRAENQPRSKQRPKGGPCSVAGEHAIAERARAAGWPEDVGFGNADGQKAMSAAMRRLEGMDFRRGRGSLTSEEREVEVCIAAIAATSLKGPTGFFRDPRRRNGLSSACRACRAAYKREYRARVAKQGERPPPSPFCVPCRDRRHGPACHGCGCRCRAMLGLDLFEGGDPTAPGVIDMMEGVG